MCSEIHDWTRMWTTCSWNLINLSSIEWIENHSEKGWMWNNCVHQIVNFALNQIFVSPIPPMVFAVQTSNIILDFLDTGVGALEFFLSSLIIRTTLILDSCIPFLIPWSDDNSNLIVGYIYSCQFFRRNVTRFVWSLFVSGERNLNFEQFSLFILIVHNPFRLHRCSFTTFSARDQNWTHSFQEMYVQCKRVNFCRGNLSSLNISVLKHLLRTGVFVVFYCLRHSPSLCGGLFHAIVEVTFVFNCPVRTLLT